RPVTSLATPPRRQMAPRRGVREDQRHHSLSVARGRPARRRARHPRAVAPSRGGGYTVFPQAAQGPALRAARAGDRQAGQLSGRSPRGIAVGDPSPLEVPQQSGRELPSADQNPGTGDETLRLTWAGPTVPVCVQPHPTALSSPSSSDQRTPMANRDDQPLRGLGCDHSRRSGMKDTVSHYVPPPSALTSTEPQVFSNNLTMPLVVGVRMFTSAPPPFAASTGAKRRATSRVPKSLVCISPSAASSLRTEMKGACKHQPCIVDD